MVYTCFVCVCVCVCAYSGRDLASPSGRQGGGGGGGGFDTDDLLPRADISASLSSAIINNMGSAQWKERKEAMEAVDKLIKDAGGRIQPQVRHTVYVCVPICATPPCH